MKNEAPNHHHVNDSEQSERRWRDDVPNHEIGNARHDGNPWTFDEGHNDEPPHTPDAASAKTGGGPKQVHDQLDQAPVQHNEPDPRQESGLPDSSPQTSGAPAHGSAAPSSGPDAEPDDAAAPIASGPHGQSGMPSLAPLDAGRTDIAPAHHQGEPASGGANVASAPHPGGSAPHQVAPTPADAGTPEAHDQGGSHPCCCGDELGWSDGDLRDAGALQGMIGQLLHGGDEGAVNLFLDIEHLDVDIFNIVQNTLVQTTEIVFDASDGGSIDVGGDVTAIGTQTALVDGFDVSHFFG
ncbi:hypothetical protein HDIA_4272 [Hartmannibacter diazotrophicus]|uniref:Uncharacterized protein n=1 Tax=Hartmannibacter diazotrophicus TaxID=1482074 RepID=A0A2C9DC45_9HYPH|nr:hypothetical protein [Hartmannibacter diazotrophicus]SON57813.1 hypothetical protein HDIA_4272 [Hartmannibacter diazotrophicus]